MGIIPARPTNFLEKYEQFKASLQVPAAPHASPKEVLILVARAAELQQRLIEHNFVNSKVVGFDLEFYARQTYDGKLVKQQIIRRNFNNPGCFSAFISIATLSNDEVTLVIDCTGQEHQQIVAILRETILENPSIIKAMCSCDNDTTRMVKDWGGLRGRSR